jgi:hypothetical protein
LLLAATGVDVLGCGRRPPVARALQHDAVHVVLDDLLGGDVEGHLGHRGLHIKDYYPGRIVAVGGGRP